MSPLYWIIACVLLHARWIGSSPIFSTTSSNTSNHTSSYFEEEPSTISETKSSESELKEEPFPAKSTSDNVVDCNSTNDCSNTQNSLPTSNPTIAIDSKITWIAPYNSYPNPDQSDNSTLPSHVPSTVSNNSTPQVLFGDSYQDQNEIDSSEKVIENLSKQPRNFSKSLTRHTSNSPLESSTEVYESTAYSRVNTRFSSIFQEDKSTVQPQSVTLIPQSIFSRADEEKLSVPQEHEENAATSQLSFVPYATLPSVDIVAGDGVASENITDTSTNASTNSTRQVPLENNFPISYDSEVATDLNDSAVRIDTSQSDDQQLSISQNSKLLLNVTDDSNDGEVSAPMRGMNIDTENSASGLSSESSRNYSGTSTPSTAATILKTHEVSANDAEYSSEEINTELSSAKIQENSVNTNSNLGIHSDNDIPFTNLSNNLQNSTVELKEKSFKSISDVLQDDTQNNSMHSTTPSVNATSGLFVSNTAHDDPPEISSTTQVSSEVSSTVRGKDFVEPSSISEERFNPDLAMEKSNLTTKSSVISEIMPDSTVSPGVHSDISESPMKQSVVTTLDSVLSSVKDLGEKETTVIYADVDISHSEIPVSTSYVDDAFHTGSKISTSTASFMDSFSTDSSSLDNVSDMSAPTKIPTAISAFDNLKTTENYSEVKNMSSILTDDQTMPISHKTDKLYDQSTNSLNNETVPDDVSKTNSEISTRSTILLENQTVPNILKTDFLDTNSNNLIDDQVLPNDPKSNVYTTDNSVTLHTTPNTDSRDEAVHFRTFPEAVIVEGKTLLNSTISPVTHSNSNSSEADTTTAVEHFVSSTVLSSIAPTTSTTTTTDALSVSSDITSTISASENTSVFMSISSSTQDDLIITAESSTPGNDLELEGRGTTPLTSEFEESLIPNVTATPVEQHREGKHIIFSTPSTTTTMWPVIESGNGTFEANLKQIVFEDITPQHQNDVMTAVIQLPMEYVNEEVLDMKFQEVHNWLQYILMKEFQNWTRDPFDNVPEEDSYDVPFGNITVSYVSPTPTVIGSNITMTFIAYNTWKNDTLPANFVLGILNFYREKLQQSMNASSVYFYHGLPRENYDFWTEVLDKHNLIICTVGVTVVVVICLMCAVLQYRRRNHHSIHHLTNSKLQASMQGIDLTPATVILQEEKNGKGPNGNMCDDEGWLVPIDALPEDEDSNVPIVQDTKL